MSLEEINSFSKENRFLSNFWPCPMGVVFDGVEYKTVEHAYQASKSFSGLERKIIASLNSAAEAKRAGKSIKNVRLDLTPSKKVEIMRECVMSKFSRDENLAGKLLDTGTAKLIEGNTWNDTFWGAVRDSDGEWIGSNHLGKILMEIRESL